MSSRLQFLGPRVRILFWTVCIDNSLFRWLQVISKPSAFRQGTTSVVPHSVGPQRLEPLGFDPVCSARLKPCLENTRNPVLQQLLVSLLNRVFEHTQSLDFHADCFAGTQPARRGAPGPDA